MTESYEARFISDVPVAIEGAHAVVDAVIKQHSKNLSYVPLRTVDFLADDLSAVKEGDTVEFSIISEDGASMDNPNPEGIEGLVLQERIVINIYKEA